MTDRNQPRAGFTLLEVILALSLTGVVLALLMTVIDLQLHRVDADRKRVETAQLARSLLERIADDLRAARYYEPSTVTSDSPNTPTEDDDNGDDSSSVESSTVLGIYGTETELRIDRAAAWRWERITQPTREKLNKTTETASDEMPLTVRYFLSEGDPFQTEELAAEGIVKEETFQGYAGLSCQRIATVAWASQVGTDPQDLGKSPPEDAKLLAPEVLEIEFAYFDGEEMLDEWNSEEQGSLPRAVEVTLKLASEPRNERTRKNEDDKISRRENIDDAIEYRLLVRLPNVESRHNPPGPRKLQ